jgi:hypothetical protein
MKEKNIPKHNIMKETFDWEVPVETVPLPSQGLVYDPDSRLYKVTTLDIKAMTAREEDILTSPALMKKGETISTLIKSCLVDESIDTNEMLLGDRNALMISIRVTGYGPDYKATFECPKCNHTNSDTVDLSGLNIKFLELEPVSKGMNSFEFTLPVTKKNITFKFMTVGEEREIAQTKEKMSKHFESQIETNVTSNLEKAIVAIDGIRDKNKIRHFVQNMPAYDSRVLRKFIRENEPGIKMEHNLVCANCSSASSVLVPMSREFFWPS